MNNKVYGYPQTVFLKKIILKIGGIDMKFNKVIISDYSEYEESRCNNGGRYSYHQHFERSDKDENVFIITYSTSADYHYCEKCATFSHPYWECYNYEQDEYQTATEQEVLSLIQVIKKGNWQHFKVDIDGKNFYFGIEAS